MSLHRLRYSRACHQASSSGWDFVGQQGGQVGQGLVLQVKGIFVAVNETGGFGLFLRRSWPDTAVAVGESECVAQEKSAVAVEIVAAKPAKDRGLRHGGLDGRVAAQQSLHGVESCIGTAQQSQASVVFRHVVHQPFGRIVGIRGFIKLLCPVLWWQQGANVHELALAQPLSVHILKNYRVSVLHKPMPVFPKGAFPILLPVGAPVWRAPQQDGPLSVGLAGRIDRRIELYSVAHRHHCFLFLVVRLHPRLVHCLMGRSSPPLYAQKQQKGETDFPHVLFHRFIVNFRTTCP